MGGGEGAERVEGVAGSEVATEDLRDRIARILGVLLGLGVVGLQERKSTGLTCLAKFDSALGVKAEWDAVNALFVSSECGIETKRLLTLSDGIWGRRQGNEEGQRNVAIAESIHDGRRRAGHQGTKACTVEVGRGSE